MKYILQKLYIYVFLKSTLLVIILLSTTLWSNSAWSTLIFANGFEEACADGMSHFECAHGEHIKGLEMWRDEVQPALVTQCGSCHMGERFGITTLKRAQADFTEEETLKNYRSFLTLTSLDNPTKSRLLAKILPTSNPNSIFHRDGPQTTAVGSELYNTISGWIELEKNKRCSNCGITENSAFIAFVQQPEINYAIPRSGEDARADRHSSSIIMQPVNSATLLPNGNSVKFLPDGFCPVGDVCDYGYMAINWAGNKLAFECRLAVGAETWKDRSWNICIAEIGEDGRAINPRFLLPEGERQNGMTISRASPIGVFSETSYHHPNYAHRYRNDTHPVFSPDDKELIFVSQAPDPQTGVDMVEAYHGGDILGHVIAYDLQTGARRTIYRNEGGQAMNPFIRANGNVVTMAWHLERTDSFVYTQNSFNGISELPVLLSRGINRWGAAHETVSGLIMGMAGRRRGTMENYTGFVSDHTLGRPDTFAEGDTDAEFAFRKLWPNHEDNFQELQFCRESNICPGQGTCPEIREIHDLCNLPFQFLDAAWSPLGGMLGAYDPNSVAAGEPGKGHDFISMWRHLVADGWDYAGVTAAKAPKTMGIGLAMPDGTRQVLINNVPGTYSRYPIFIGKRYPPTQEVRVELPTQGEISSTTINIPSFKHWLHLANGRLPSGIVAVRVLHKVVEDNACVFDFSHFRQSNYYTEGWHPTAQGMADATAFMQYVVPQAMGGTAFGDIPLKPDGSIAFKIPDGKLIQLQGVDEFGQLVALRKRVFSMQGGGFVNMGVRADQHTTQCARCHGSTDGTPHSAIANLADVPATLSFENQALAAGVIDLTDATVVKRELSFRSAIRPILDAKCVSCHQGEAPQGGLSLQASYSSGNFPAEPWMSYLVERNDKFLAWANSICDGCTTELNFPMADRIPSVNFSMPFSYVASRNLSTAVRSAFATEIANHVPLGELAPWDSGYQNLWRQENGHMNYLTAWNWPIQFARVPGNGVNSRRSFLMEVLTGRDLDEYQVYTGSQDHTGMLTQMEQQTLSALLDVGFPYMARCTDRTVPSGPNAGLPWGDGHAISNLE